MNQMTSPAQAMTPLVNLGIIWRIFVATRAMRATALIFSRFATSRIFCVRYGLQMFRINTGANSAFMVKLQSFRDWADKDQVRSDMSVDGALFPRSQSDSPVAVRAHCGQPQPTSRIWFWTNLIQQPIHQGFLHSSHSISGVTM